MNKRNHTVAAGADVRVLKAGSCPSLSGKSRLRWELGCTSDGAIRVRIAQNSGTGYFNDDWVDWAALVDVFERHDQRPITSGTLAALYPGRSANSGGFLLAALKDRGLVGRSADNQRTYQRLDGSAFLAEITALTTAPMAPVKAAKVAKAVAARKR